MPNNDCKYCGCTKEKCDTCNGIACCPECEHKNKYTEEELQSALNKQAEEILNYFYSWEFRFNERVKTTCDGCNKMLVGYWHSEDKNLCKSCLDKELKKFNREVKP